MSTQLALLPLPPVAQARALLARCLPELSRWLTVKRSDGHLHLRECRRGMWVAGYSWPHGAPCSERCARLRTLVAEVAAYLEQEP